MKYAILYDGKLYIADERWITINADKETGQKGQHVLIKENGDIVYGLGGMFKNLRDLGKKKTGIVVTKDEMSDYLMTRDGKKFRKLADPHFCYGRSDVRLAPDEIANFNPVKYHEKQPSEEEIINTLGGADKTKGSCVSLALAYTAQKNGIDILDFRGEPSRTFFAYDGFKDVLYGNAVIGRETDTIKGAMKVLQKVDSAPAEKEFLLSCGNHMAVVKKVADGSIEYLELQSDVKCGWRNMGTVGSDRMKKTLRSRFKVAVFFKDDYKKKYWESMVFDCDKLKELEIFKYSLGFINTDKDKQKKGAGGGIK